MLHLPSSGPYRARWGTWAASLIHHGLDDRQMLERLESTPTGMRARNPDLGLPIDLPPARLSSSNPVGLNMSVAELDPLRSA